MLAELAGRKPGAPLQMALPWSAAPEEDLQPVERLALEIEMLGWPVSAHPLAPFAPLLAERDALSSDALARQAGRRAIAAGARMRLWREHRGEITLEDEAGLFGVRVAGGQSLRPGALGKLGPYLVQGRVQVDRWGQVTILAEQIAPL